MNIDIRKTIELVENLSSAAGCSGDEEEIAKILATAVDGWMKTRTDSMGNVFLETQENKKSVICLDAHLDEVGLMVQSVEKNGLFHALPLGGISIQSVGGTTFLCGPHKVKATAASIPVHYLEKQPDSFDQMLFDAGCTSKEELESLGIEPGCFMVPDTGFAFREKEGVFYGKAFDDRIGVAAMVLTLQKLKEAGLLSSVMAIGSVQEEVGDRGIACAIHQIRASYAICFEGAPADDAYADHPQTAMKQGVMVRYLDRSMIANQKLIDLAKECAGEKEIPIQFAVRKSGGTNAAIFQQNNIPSIVLGIPVRYAHAPAGYCALSDLEAAVDLAFALCKKLIEKEG